MGDISKGMANAKKIYSKKLAPTTRPPLPSSSAYSLEAQTIHTDKHLQRFKFKALLFYS
jgi:hypothetical protein